MFAAAATLTLIAAHPAWAGNFSSMANPWVLASNSFLAGCIGDDHDLNTIGARTYYVPKSTAAFYAAVEPYVAARHSGRASLALGSHSLPDGQSSTQYGAAVWRRADQAKTSSTSPVKVAVFSIVGGASDALVGTGRVPVETTADVHPIQWQYDPQPLEIDGATRDPVASAPRRASGNLLLLLGFLMIGLVANRRASSRGKL
jgi:hypothetical protein